ncbi:PH domain-containing protein [Nocardia amikacinitolerans]|uniref:PH domain-containing protein n=1 Tax=Nocardia amikacinitolerans TaxID=756689 RepID=A0A285LQU9_9NOCA|nr:PH domain-containing protein [Nocardia amikacinitolerans]MCP2276748.1 PH domain-containing protein [Nocardia amikacinitolerans]MCP2294872.1 PH domain-containing protein [Nocardia amikacinitolerans]MCP2318579.1 PH domain-containing protein [Nocardia amikacinitolerans]SNY87300.1 PH domain-containing protein [Nocardia amikacinitolerans]
MNPESPSVEPRLAWTTPTPALVAVAVGGVILAGAAIFAADAASRLLIGLAAAGLLALAGLGFRQRPRLSIHTGADPRLVVRGLLGPAEYRPEQIVKARVVSYRRLGRKSPMLEIDVEHEGQERLLIFGRWDLGTAPQDVFEALVAHRLAYLPSD